MKIIVYGTGHCAEQLIHCIENRSDISIACFAETIKTKELFCGRSVIKAEQMSNYSDIDYIVVASLSYWEIKNHIVTLFDDLYRVIHYADFFQVIQNRRDNMAYESVETNIGLRFLYDKDDKYVGPEMRLTGKVFSCDEIDWFIEMTKEHYGQFPSEGYFIDVGANIGTTSIYFKKKNPAWNCVAIEPSRKNFRMLKANCIINDMEDINCVLVALSNQNGSDELCYFQGNPGASAIVGADQKRAYAKTGLNSSEGQLETVQLRKLDSVLADNSIPMSEVNYLWIDTQGFEPKVLEGATKLLSDHPIAIFQEFNPQVYRNNSEWGLFKRIVMEHYSHFIAFGECNSNNYRIREVSELENYAEKMIRNHMEFDDIFWINKFV